MSVTPTDLTRITDIVESTVDAAALVAGLAVVAESCDDAPERRRSGIEPRAPGVVLEAGEGL